MKETVVLPSLQGMRLLEKNVSNAKGKVIDSYTFAVKKDGIIIGYLPEYLEFVE